MTGSLDAISAASLSDVASNDHALPSLSTTAGDMINSATDPDTGVTDTHALASKVAEMYRNSPDAADGTRSGIEQQLLSAGKFNDNYHFSHNLAQLHSGAFANQSAPMASSTGNWAASQNVFAISA